ncbi:hypothetical protein [Citrobacter arsenatis]|uniref:F4 family fimbrial subunit n=1 Tax=Citrobacter arsenatis TaxID=2546350 RepID=UPI003AB98E96
MKLSNTLVALGVMAASGLVSVAQAAFTEDTGYAGVKGDITFSGTVTDMTPKWMWEVSNAGKPYTGYDININLGTSAAGKSTFAYTAMPDITLLQGYLKSPAPNGGLGLQPVVTLGVTGQDFTLVTGTVSSDNLTATVKATGTLPDKTTVDGLLQFDLAQGGVIAGTEGGTAKIQPGAFLASVAGGTAANSPAVANSGNAKYGAALTAATTLLAQGADYATSDYDGKALDKGRVWAASTMTNYNVKNIYAAYSSVISNVKTIWTATEVPESWTADIGVTVTHQ